MIGVLKSHNWVSHDTFDISTNIAPENQRDTWYDVNIWKYHLQYAGHTLLSFSELVYPKKPETM